MDIKLVALDLDDTLLTKSLTVSPRTQEVIAQAVAQGVTVTVATGRMYSSALPYAQQLKLDVPLITYNGGLIRSCLSGETIHHQPIAEAVAHQILALFKEKGWYIQAYVDDFTGSLLWMIVNDAAGGTTAARGVGEVGGGGVGAYGFGEVLVGVPDDGGADDESQDGDDAAAAFYAHQR